MNFKRNKIKMSFKTKNQKSKKYKIKPNKQRKC